MYQQTCRWGSSSAWHPLVDVCVMVTPQTARCHLALRENMRKLERKKNCRREQSTGWSCSVLGQTHFLLHLPCFCSLSKTCVYILTCKCVYINTHYPLNPILNRLPSLHLLLELHCFPQRWCRLLESKLKNCLNGAIWSNSQFSFLSGELSTNSQLPFYFFFLLFHICSLTQWNCTDEQLRGAALITSPGNTQSAAYVCHVRHVCEPAVRYVNVLLQLLCR